jgi:hypothetical protein
MVDNFGAEKIFIDILDKIKSTGSIVDEYYIKNLLKNWKIKDFRYNNEGNVTNEFAIKELEKIIEKLLVSIPQNLIYTILGLTHTETITSYKDELCTNTLFLCMFSFGIYRYFAKKINKLKNNEEKIVFSNITATMLDNVKGIVFSYLSGDTLTVIQKTRIVYECCIIFWFINNHKELVKPFLDHIKIIEHRIFKDMPGYENDKIGALKSSYDDEFYDYLGWTKNVISEKKNRNLEYMAKDIGIDGQMSLLYKLSSNYIHTNAYSSFIKNTLDPHYVRIYLPVVSDMLIRQMGMFVRIVNDVEYENELIGILLNRLEELLFHDFVFNRTSEKK